MLLNNTSQSTTYSFGSRGLHNAVNIIVRHNLQFKETFRKPLEIVNILYYYIK